MELEINGFKIIQELPVEKKEVISGNGKKRYAYRRFVIAICKQCGNEWEVVKSSLSRTNSCGCKRAVQYKDLPAEINGFKITKDLGNEENIRKAMVECKECKRIYETYPWQLVNRHHCGCIKKGTKVCKYRKSHPRLLDIFSAMKARCNNPKDTSYAYYGAKGTKVCDEWMKEPDNFCKWALENGYTDELTIDRLDNKLGYQPDNCKWSNRVEQGRNRSTVKLSLDIARKIRDEFMSDPLFSFYLQSLKYDVSVSSIESVLKNKCWKES